MFFKGKFLQLQPQQMRMFRKTILYSQLSQISEHLDVAFILWLIIILASDVYKPVPSTCHFLPTDTVGLGCYSNAVRHSFDSIAQKLCSQQLWALPTWQKHARAIHNIAWGGTDWFRFCSDEACRPSQASQIQKRPLSLAGIILRCPSRVGRCAPASHLVSSCSLTTKKQCPLL